MISEKPWSADSVLRLFLGIIMTVCFGLCLASLLPADKMRIGAEHREFARVGLTGLFFQGGILVWIWFFLRETATSWSDAFGLGSPAAGQSGSLGRDGGGVIPAGRLGNARFVGVLD